LAETSVSTEVPAASQPEEHEPLTFAQRIRDLIESLPLPGTSATSQQSEKDATNVEVSKAKDGTTGPPAAPGVDEELVQMLSSEEVMNGDEEEAGKEKLNRPSVWSILSTMRWKGKEKDMGGAQNSSDPITHVEGGLMMCAPLEPTNDSNVELAQTCPSPSESPNRPNSPILEQPGEDVEWVPSTTQISVYAAWWGYRLYLPPSVMAALDSVSFKATTQAAMVTGALKWLLDQVPTMLVPPQFRPALMMMKRLGPIVGYVGVFVAWSWGRIKTHDKGNGVVRRQLGSCQLRSYRWHGTLEILMDLCFCPSRKTENRQRIVRDSRMRTVTKKRRRRKRKGFGICDTLCITAHMP